MQIEEKAMHNLLMQYGEIKDTGDLKTILRYGEWAWPGGYPMFIATDDGGCLHFDCVKENFRSVVWSIKNECSDGWRAVAWDINYEDGSLTCDHCNKRIESAYAEE